jgi:hypothetical protein
MDHAAAYISLKCFCPTLAGCQHATLLQLQPSMDAPVPPKMLLHLTLVQVAAALSMLCAMLTAVVGEQPLIMQ